MVSFFTRYLSIFQLLCNREVYQVTFSLLFWWALYKPKFMTSNIHKLYLTHARFSCTACWRTANKGKQIQWMLFLILDLEYMYADGVSPSTQSIRSSSGGSVFSKFVLAVASSDFYIVENVNHFWISIMCVCACVCACVRLCVRACLHTCVRVYILHWTCLKLETTDFALDSSCCQRSFQIPTKSCTYSLSRTFIYLQ